MGEAVDELEDAGGIGKEISSFLKNSVCGLNDGAAFVASVDDLEEEISSTVVGGRVADFVNADEAEVGVAAELSSSDFGRPARRNHSPSAR